MKYWSKQYECTAQWLKRNKLKTEWCDQFFFNFYSLSRNRLAQLADNSHGHGFLKSPRKIVYNWRKSLILIQRFCNSETTVNTCLVKATAVHSTWCLFLKFCALVAKIQTRQKKSCFCDKKFENLKPWRNPFYPGNDTIVTPMSFFPPT